MKSVMCVSHDEVRAELGQGIKFVPQAFWLVS